MIVIAFWMSIAAGNFTVIYNAFAGIFYRLSKGVDSYYGILFKNTI